MKFRYVAGIVAVLLITAIGILLFAGNENVKISEGFKCNYIFINSNSRENTIEYYVYESFYSEESNENDNVQEAYILDDLNNKINIDIESITKEEQPIYTKKGDMYKKTITFSIKGVNDGLYSNTSLYIKMYDEPKTLEYIIGDIYFFSPKEEEYESNEIELLQITPVLSDKNDVPYVVGLILEVDIKTDICITDFKMGLPDYCTYKSNITKIDKSFDEVVALDDWNYLDQEIKDVYTYSDISVAEQSISSCYLEKGINVIVIPFSHSENSKFLYSCGGKLEYRVDNEYKVLIIEPSRRVAISSFSKEALEKEVFDE